MMALSDKTQKIFDKVVEWDKKKIAWFQHSLPERYETLAKIKTTLDPNYILNPGCLVSKIEKRNLHFLLKQKSPVSGALFVHIEIALLLNNIHTLSCCEVLCSHLHEISSLT